MIYLDPPFNSNRNYSVLLRNEAGTESEAQITAFEDTWHWNIAAEQTYNELINEPGQVGRMIESFRQFIGTNQMLAYLVMMAVRLKELHRVLKPTGSLYLHCGPTATHYLKILLDTIFGPENFANDITWKRTTSHNDARRKFGDLCDDIFLYARSSGYKFQVQFIPYTNEDIKQHYRHLDDNGRRYTLDNLRSPNPRPNLTYEYKGYKPHENGWTVSLERMNVLDAQGRIYFPESKDGRIRIKKFLDEMPGVPVGNIWDDLPPIQAHDAIPSGLTETKRTQPTKLCAR